MTLYRWLARGFHNDRIVEAGETVDVDPGVVPGAHMAPIDDGGVDAEVPDVPEAPAIMPRAMGETVDAASADTSSPIE